MTASVTKKWTDAERIEAQRQCVEHHVALENAGEQSRVLKETFATEGVFYDVVPGVTHFEGLQGVADFYDMLFSVLPDMHIKVTHTYDVPGCCVREGVVTGTHSAEFAGVPASGKFISFPFCGLYIFGDDPTKLIAERAYWDNDGLFRQMRGEEDASQGTPWDTTQ
ncbi:ester cyclase [Rhodococcus sp. T7]|uniref:ester cyclase n=1 Tax=Rhodococcus sp. T7 TaxID=627444 RepID=UPI00135739C1|nr:ester cyclase [Rhodococcus sp. T7]KAF0957838.1 hypothetical protein MLGJGCBP_09670 [Rhodococcus sp. T7]KAF0961509.1 hypothetical protein MLGJGCBP_05389 [Rhodococcus sp. T7]